MKRYRPGNIDPLLLTITLICICVGLALMYSRIGSMADVIHRLP